MTAQVVDLNGFIEIKGNPISKVGVYPYLGKEIGAPEPDRVYRVYRPESELSSQETIDSFKLMPLVDQHAMLGSEDAGLTPAERKGVQGVIGETVYFDSPYLKGNIKIYSEAAKGLIATETRRELSPGYRFKIDFTPGVFDGEQYDAIQRQIRANHLALVEEGRTGPDVAVLDSAQMLCALDFNSLKEAVMADETKATGDDAVAELKELLTAVVARLDALESKEEVKVDVDDEKAEDEEKVEVKAEDEEVEVKAEDEEKVEVKAMDAMARQIKRLEKQLLQAQDSGALIASIADRDALADKLSGFVGAFDHSVMTAQAVAAYGVEKLGIPCQKGQERTALDAWLHGRTPQHKQATVIGFDSKSSAVDLNALWKEAN